MINCYALSALICAGSLGLSSMTFAQDVPDKMILVQGGVFAMGSEDDDAFENEKPVHTIHIHDFFMSRNEVTFAEYDLFCLKTNRTRPKDETWGRGNRPVINVSWLDAVQYCNWLSQRHKLQPCYTVLEDESVTCDWAASGYRLPTEAEWEYAARGGHKTNQTRFSGANDPTQVAWFWDNSEQKTHPVGEKQANELGIYDMTGNVWEWCWDWVSEDYYAVSANKNPLGPSKGQHRALRGGSWLNRPYGLRNSFRRWDLPSNKSKDYGFRIVRNAQPTTAADAPK